MRGFLIHLRMNTAAHFIPRIQTRPANVTHSYSKWKCQLFVPILYPFTLSQVQVPKSRNLHQISHVLREGNIQFTWETRGMHKQFLIEKFDGGDYLKDEEW